MATFELPASSTGEAFQFEVELQGALFTFLFLWNSRDAHWYMTVSDSNGVPILSGRRVVVDWPLLRNVADLRRPKGEIVALDTTGEGDPGLADLGGRVPLLYEEK